MKSVDEKLAQFESTQQLLWLINNCVGAISWQFNNFAWITHPVSYTLPFFRFSDELVWKIVEQREFKELQRISFEWSGFIFILLKMPKNLR